MRGPRMDVSSSVTVVFAPNVSNGSGAGWRCRFSLLAPVRTVTRPCFVPKNIGISMVMSRTDLPVHTVNAT